MTKKPRENRVPIMMSDEELTAIDDWRYRNRVATRSDAVRRLCQIGIIADEHFDALVDNYLGMSYATMEIAVRGRTHEEAMAVLRQVSEFGQHFGRMRGAILSMRKSERIETAFAEFDEIKKAYEDQDPNRALDLMRAYLDSARAERS
jgi:hypothetical protein